MNACFLLLLLASAIVPDPAPVAADRVLTGFDPHAIAVGMGDDGSAYALGRNWKLRVGPIDSEFVPLIGPAAQSNHPLGFGAPRYQIDDARFESVLGTPRLEDARIEIDRGPIVETYDLLDSGVKQSFVLEHVPFRGEVVFTLPIATDLRDVASPLGLCFEASGLVRVHYSDATIVDAAGRTVAVPSQRVAEGIEIRVPESFVREASLPITIDPFVSTLILINNDAPSAIDPDVAYDAASDRFLVAWTVAASGTDRDVKAQIVTGAGTKTAFFVIDATVTADVSDPCCANNSPSGDFLVAYRRAGPASPDPSEIRGRFIRADGTLENPIVLSAGDEGETTPSVGGASTGDKYLLAYERDATVANPNRQAVARTVSTAGGVSPAVTIEATDAVDETRPRVSKHARANSGWMVVHVDPDASDSQIRGSLFSATLGAIAGSIPLETDTLNDRAPIVAEVGEYEYVVFWQRDMLPFIGVDHDIVGARYAGQIGAITALTPIVNFTDRVGGAFQVEEIPYSLAVDGGRFALVDGFGTTTRVTTMVWDADQPEIVEGPLPVPLQGSLVGTGAGVMTFRSESGGTLGRGLLALETQLPSSTDISAILFDSLLGGGVTTIATGCGGALEPILSASSVAPICGSFTLTLAGFTSPLLVVGLPATIPLCVGQGGCVLGATPLVMTPLANGSFPFVLPCDPTLLALSIAMTGVDLLPAGTTSDACGPPKYAQRFRTSDTLRLDFQ